MGRKDRAVLTKQYLSTSSLYEEDSWCSLPETRGAAGGDFGEPASLDESERPWPPPADLAFAVSVVRSSLAPLLLTAESDAPKSYRLLQACLAGFSRGLGGSRKSWWSSGDRRKSDSAFLLFRGKEKFEVEEDEPNSPKEGGMDSGRDAMETALLLRGRDSAS